MTYKLVAIDLDGTLLPNTKVLAPSTEKLIKETTKRGIHFTIATGRMFKGAVRYAKQLGIQIPIITYNGAIIKNPHSCQTYREFKVSADMVKRALDILSGKPVLRYVFVDDDVYTDTPHEWTDNYANILEVEMKYVDDVQSLLYKDPIMAVFMVSANERQNITSLLKNSFDSEVRITNSSDWFVDILHPKASKSRALEQLAKSLNIDRNEIIAIGDNLNDLEMIEYAGLGVAVGNASSELKEAADYITKASFNEGVEEVITKFLLN